MPLPRVNNPRSRLLTAFVGFAFGVLIVTVLFFAQTIFIPIALAVFLTFLLAPIVDRLERGVGRTAATIATVLATTGLLIGVGWMVTHEMSGLVGMLKEPKYADNIREKVKKVEDWFQSGVLTELSHFTRTFARRGSENANEGQDENNQQAKDKGTAEQPKTEANTNNPAPAAGGPPTPFWLGEIPASLSRLGEDLAQTALVVVLVVFMLLRREDLRNRVIRLIGHGRLTVTTIAIDDAASRVSRFLFVQLVVNSCYGLVFAAGLWLLHVPYAFLWGFLAGVMRYVPYVGIWLAVLPPIALSLAVAPGWSLPLWVVGMVAVLEVVCANFVEPVLFGQTIGVSEVALLVSAAFWAWLWGPIGLVLSAPLTVCLVVLGKYVPQLEFFDVLLGDAPVLPARLVFYQRLLARDQDEAAAVIEKFAKTAPAEAAYDEFLVPTLVSARRDLDSSDLSEEDERFIVSAVAELSEQLSAGDPTPSAPAVVENATAEVPRAIVVGCPARDDEDEVALGMLRSLLGLARWELDILPAAALAAELIEKVEKVQPAAICIVALPPGGVAHTRYLCKRLRQRFADLKLAVGLWGLEGDISHARDALAAAGADHVSTRILETRAQLSEWLPVFATAAANDSQSPALAGR
jgi:predicted PurR-regulated permease PerM